MVMESGWSWADKPDAARQGFQAPLLDLIAARCPPQSRTSCTHRASVRGTRDQPDATALRFLASDDRGSASNSLFEAELMSIKPPRSTGAAEAAGGFAEAGGGFAEVEGVAGVALGAAVWAQAGAARRTPTRASIEMRTVRIVASSAGIGETPSPKARPRVLNGA
jgi:hypothetical protein